MAQNASSARRLKPSKAEEGSARVLAQQPRVNFGARCVLNHPDLPTRDQHCRRSGSGGESHRAMVARASTRVGSRRGLHRIALAPAVDGVAAWRPETHRSPSDRSAVAAWSKPGLINSAGPALWSEETHQALFYNTLAGWYDVKKGTAHVRGGSTLIGVLDDPAPSFARRSMGADLRRLVGQADEHDLVLTLPRLRHQLPVLQLLCMADQRI